MEFLAFGGIIFWSITALVFLALIAEVDRDKYWGAFWTIAAYAGAIALFSDLNLSGIWPYIKANPWTIAYGVGAYIVAGTVWSVIKWYFVLVKMREKYEAFRTSYFKKNKIEGELFGKQKDDFKSELQGQFGWNVSFPPKASEHKARIVAWMAYWPFSLVATVLGDVLVRIFKKTFEIIENVFTTIYTAITGFMQNISNRMFGKYSELN